MAAGTAPPQCLQGAWAQRTGDAGFAQALCGDGPARKGVRTSEEAALFSVVHPAVLPSLLITIPCIPNIASGTPRASARPHPPARAHRQPPPGARGSRPLTRATHMGSPPGSPSKRTKVGRLQLPHTVLCGGQPPTAPPAPRPPVPRMCQRGWYPACMPLLGPAVAVPDNTPRPTTSVSSQPAPALQDRSITVALQPCGSANTAFAPSQQFCLLLLSCPLPPCCRAPTAPGLLPTLQTLAAVS